MLPLLDHDIKALLPRDFKQFIFCNRPNSRHLLPTFVFYSWPKILVPSMWFWSVSWLTNCPVYFSFFLVDQKKIVQSQGIFGQSLGIFGQSLGIFGGPKKILMYQKEIWLTKNSQRLTKNSLRLDNFFWSTKKNEKKTGQLVDQETDQNHMDGTNNNHDFSFLMDVR